MSRSEIDDIFAASTAPPTKKIKSSHPEQQKISSKSRHHPETVLDPSKKQTRRREKSKKLAKSDEDRFKDSRGSAPRRKTDDGFTIYKEDELGITTTGGGDHPTQSFLALLNRFVQTPLSARLIASAVFETERNVSTHSCITCCPISFLIFSELALRSSPGGHGLQGQYVANNMNPFIQPIEHRVSPGRI